MFSSPAVEHKRSESLFDEWSYNEDDDDGQADDDENNDDFDFWADYDDEDVIIIGNS